LGVIFFANKFTSTVEPIAFVPVEASSASGNQGFADDPEPPGIDEGAELAEPQLEDALDALSTLNVDQTLLADQLYGATEEASKGEGAGDARQPGPGGEGVIERVPRWERWKIRWEPSSSAQFVQWLDQYKIRIGVLGRDNKVHAAWDFGRGSPQVAAEEPKNYVAWGQTVPSDGPMPGLVQGLARKAGILGRGPIVVLLYPFEVEQILWTLEQKKNPSGDPNKVRETLFTVVANGDSFGFEIVDQKYF
jgi:hypothetical protein